MQMKKNHSNPEKRTLKKQLISGGVYIALSAVAVAVTVNTAVSMLSKNTDLPSIDDSLKLPTVPENIAVPEIDLPNTGNLLTFPDKDISVSDSPSGISAEITQSEASGISDTVPTEELSQTEESSIDKPILDVAEISSNANLGENVFVKPCDGFITVGHSVDMPVYSPTLGDYRTHSGVDIAADMGAIVKAVKGGVVTKIYSDDLYGSCLELETPDGYTFVYSNLTPALSEGIEEGIAVSTGTIIGSVGDSAILEAAQESHLHFELRKDGASIDPEDVISF